MRRYKQPINRREVWTDVVGWDYYQVSTYARIRSWRTSQTMKFGIDSARITPKILKMKVVAGGHIHAQFGRKFRKPLRHVVLEAFVGKKPSKDSIACCTKDDPSECRPHYLYWGRFDRSEDRKKWHSRFLGPENAKLIKQGLGDGIPAWALADCFGVSLMTINRVGRGESYSFV